MRLIDADIIIKNLTGMKFYYDAIALDGIIKALKDAPTIEAVPVVHGEWIKHEYAEESEGLLIPNFECSVCHDWKREETPFCPECGARMDGKAV